MRKLKLQVQMSVDGFIAGPNGEMDWMVMDWDDKIRNYVLELTEPVDTILLGRKMTEGFVSYWSDVLTKPDDPSSIDRSHAFAKKMIDRRNLQTKEYEGKGHHCLWRRFI
jgi:dihydrofolate reductase